MPLIDSPYTNPDALRLLYINPKNVLRDLDNLAGADGQQSFSSGSVPPLTGVVGGGFQGDSGPQTGCPAVGQYTIAWMPGTRTAKRPMQVERLIEGVKLWQPLTKEFKKIVEARIIKDVECVKYRTFDGVESIVTLTDRPIQSLEDKVGRQMMDLINNPDAVHTALTSIEFNIGQSAIEWIASVGRMDAVRITLEGEDGDIYASGSNPLYMTIRHNNKPGVGGGIGPVDPPER